MADTDPPAPPHPAAAPRHRARTGLQEGLFLDGIALCHRDGMRLAGIDRHIAPGEILSVMGPSGIGKSTLLSAILGTLPPGFRLSGRICLDGTDVTALPPHRRRIGLLFQDPMLFDHLSVGDNLAFALPRSTPGAARHTTLLAALAEIGLEGFYARDPATLSGGQRARVALMRTLLAAPRALLLDEPFASLDTQLRAQMRSLVFRHARERALPVVLVTHDPADAEAAQGPVLMLSQLG